MRDILPSKASVDDMGVTIDGRPYDFSLLSDLLFRERSDRHGLMVNAMAMQDVKYGEIAVIFVWFLGCDAGCCDANVCSITANLCWVWFVVCGLVAGKYFAPANDE